MNKLVLKEIFISAILVAVLHQIALSLYLYWTTDWYDIMMHFLGGIVIGLIAFTIFNSIFGQGRDDGTNNSPNRPDFSRHFWLNFSFTVGGVIIIGLGWELWELFVQFIDPVEDRFDTILDLIMDTLGGIVAFIYSFKKFNNNGK